ncbi:MAG: zinc ABC transporter substrate-binding protein [Alloprevotella sp.]|nr:zinc ABC transporter substrate-binding protein [Alloprevotella sp.]
MMKRYIVLLAVALCIMGCRYERTDSRPIISVSVAPIGALVEAIAGTEYRINVMVPEGASPETYELTFDQIVGLENCRLCLLTGTLGFEQMATKALLSKPSSVLVQTLNDSVQLLPTVLDGLSSDGADPHIWLSVTNAKIISRQIYHALCLLNPDNKETYTHNIQQYMVHLDSLDVSLREQLQLIPQRTILVHHPALGYYCRDYGLRQLSIEQNGKEPSVARIEQLIRTCRSDSVGRLFVERSYSGATADILVREAGLTRTEYNPLSPNWEQTLQDITLALQP